MLDLKQVSVAVENTTIINALSLHIKPGTVHILMGPNGSGKSSLAATLMGHPRYRITQGSIVYKGIPIQELPPEERARQGIFLAFQHPCALAGISVRAFLKEICQAVTGNILSDTDFMDQVQEACTVLGLDQAWLYRRFDASFSGGERKRLELLQMLLLRPRLIMLDEVDAGLDVDGLKRVVDSIAYLRSINPEASFLVITHTARLVEYLTPDAVHVLIKGALVCSGDSSLVKTIAAQGYAGFAK